MAKIKTTDKSNYDSITMNIHQLNQSDIQVGVFGEDGSFQVMKASVHEFGVTINVTPKMRAWFAYQGYPLKASTTEIKIPERSFLRAAFDDNEKLIEKKGVKAIAKIITGDSKAPTEVAKFGLKLESLVKAKMTEVDMPPLSDMTKERRKGGNPNPLVDDGRMRRGITFKVE